MSLGAPFFWRGKRKKNRGLSAREGEMVAQNGVAPGIVKAFFGREKA